MDHQAINLLSDGFERLQLLQAEHDRVLLHHLRGVEQRPGRSGFLTPADDVGLRLFLRQHHGVEDLAHLARQDHVLQRDLADLDADFHHRRPHPLRRLGVDRDLLRQDLVERLGAERFAERILHLAVQRVGEVLHHGRRLHRVGHAIFGGEVHPDRDAILGQNLLTRHVQRHTPSLDQLHHHPSADVPEHVRARGEHAKERAVDEQQADLLLFDIVAGDPVRRAETLEPPLQPGRQGQIRRHVEPLHLPGTGVLPEHRAPIRLQDCVDPPVPQHHADLVRPGAHLKQVRLGQIRPLTEQRRLQRGDQFRARNVMGLELHVSVTLVLQGREDMLTRTQDIQKPALCSAITRLFSFTVRRRRPIKKSKLSYESWLSSLWRITSASG